MKENYAEDEEWDPKSEVGFIQYPKEDWAMFLSSLRHDDKSIQHDYKPGCKRKVYRHWDSAFRVRPSPCSETVIRIPDERHEICRGSCDLSEAELNSMLKPKQKEMEKEMENRIIDLLGLSNDASESEVYQAVKDLKDRLASAEARLLEIEANEFVEANSERISNADTFKELYKRHGREIAEAFLSVVK